jgi:hypothetical protein
MHCRLWLLGWTAHRLVSWRYESVRSVRTRRDEVVLTKKLETGPGVLMCLVLTAKLHTVCELYQGVMGSLLDQRLYCRHALTGYCVMSSCYLPDCMSAQPCQGTDCPTLYIPGRPVVIYLLVVTSTLSYGRPLLNIQGKQGGDPGQKQAEYEETPVRLEAQRRQ